MSVIDQPKKDEQRRAQLQQRAQMLGLEQEMILKFLQNKAELERISAELSKPGEKDEPA